MKSMYRRTLMKCVTAGTMAFVLLTETALTPALAATPAPTPAETLVRVLATRGLDAADAQLLRDHFESIRRQIQPEVHGLGLSLSPGLPAASGAVGRAVVAFFLRTVVWARLETDVDTLRGSLARALESEGPHRLALRLSVVKHPAVMDLIRDLEGAKLDGQAARAVDRFAGLTLHQIKTQLLDRAGIIARGGLSHARALIGDVQAGGESALVALAAMPIEEPITGQPASRRLDWLFRGDNMRKALVALAVVSGIGLAVFLSIAGGVIAPFVTLLGAVGAIIALLGTGRSSPIDVGVPQPFPTPPRS